MSSTPTSLEFRHLRYFVTLAEELHFGQAATRLHIVQPALSMQIKALEAILGAELFQRTNRRVQLTEAGALFLAEARAILMQVDHATQLSGRAGRGEIGRLRIGYSGNAAYAGVMAQSIRAFRQRYPDVDILLQEMPTRAQFKDLQDGRLDVGFVTLFSQDVPDTLRISRVGIWPWVMALADIHPQAERQVVDLSSLADELFLIYSDSDSELELLPILQRFGGFRPRKIQRLSNAMTIMAMIAAGLGIAVVPEPLCKIHVEHVVYRPLPENKEKAELAIAYHFGKIERVGMNFVDMSINNN